MDWFAIVSWGTYPTPTPTNSERAAFAVSYGLLDTAPVAAQGGGSFIISLLTLLDLL